MLCAVKSTPKFPFSIKCIITWKQTNKQYSVEIHTVYIKLLATNDAAELMKVFMAIMLMTHHVSSNMMSRHTTKTLISSPFLSS